MFRIAQKVTFGVIAYNEHRYLPDLLDDLLKQTYPKENIELIMVDGGSSDGTWQIMENFREKYQTEYSEIKLLYNPKKVQPAGWNIVICHMTGDILLRIDAHARLPEDFIEKNVACINSGESVCGGPRENIIDEKTNWKSMLLCAERSMFGAGIAYYRKGTEKRKNVNSVFHGAYRKEVFDKAGFFNEGLVRTEDNEFHYRIRKCGYMICYNPVIKSYYHTRNSLRGMIKQKFLNGFWIGKTLFICPGCISFFHLVPFGFVLAILLSTLIIYFGITWPAKVLWASYGIVNLLISTAIIMETRDKNIYYIALPIIFLLLHTGYGIGTILGILKR